MTCGLVFACVAPWTNAVKNFRTILQLKGIKDQSAKKQKGLKGLICKIKKMKIELIRD